MGGRAPQTVPDEDLPDPEPDDQAELSPRGIRCAAGRSSYCITWDGKMKPCNSFPGIDEDVFETSFKEAWKKINEHVNALRYPPECDTCRYRKACKTCIVEHLDAEGCSRHANPRVCEFVKRFVHEGFVKM